MTTFFVLTILFIVVSVAMILIILVQRSQGGGLAGAFGGAGGGSTDTVFGGRVGDALTWATVVAFVIYLGIAVLLNRVDITGSAPATVQDATLETPVETADPATDPAGVPVDAGSTLPPPPAAPAGNDGP